MRRLAACLCLFASLFVSSAHALDLNSTYYDIYEKPGTSGQTIIYIVPKPSVLILASEPITPITFMPQSPGFSAIVGADGNFGSLTQNTYNSNDMAGLGALKSTYKLFGGDFDGDGRADFFLQGSGNRSSVVIATDAGTGSAVVRYDFKNNFNSAVVQVSVGDLNGDGRTDIVAIKDGLAVNYLANTFDGPWSNSNEYYVGFIGSINGKFRVDEQGAATYSVDILSAPGTAGVAPHISLNYSSSGGSGIAGQGWSIGGISAISRCRQTLSQDNKVRGITFTAEDRFCLDGQRLILTSGTYGSSGSTYRTEIDSYAVVTAVGGAAGAPTYFTVTRKDGSVSQYGNGNGSAQQVGSNTLSWAISSFQDSVGNPIRFSYADGGAGHRISRIDYAYGATGVPASSSSTYIGFEYENRPDASSGYIGGSGFSIAQRLASIKSYGGGVELRRYNLVYSAADAANPRSVLAKLFECVASNCLSPLVFNWAAPQNGFSSAAVAASVGGQVSGAKFGDFNGDGQLDIAYIAGSGSAWNIYYQLSSGTGFGAASLVGAVDGADANFAIIDMNNDGRQDLVFGRAGQNWQVASGSSSGLVAAASIGFGYNKNAQFVDIDSDGLVDSLYPVDIVTSGIHSYEWRFRRLQRTVSGPSYVYSFSAENAAPLIDPAGGPYGLVYLNYAYGSPITADFNGDGRLDIVAYQTLPFPDSGSATMRAFIAADNGAFVADSFLAYGNSTAIPLDLNSDGLPDLIYGQQYMGQPGQTWKYRLNTGAPATDTSGDVTLGMFANDRFTFDDYNNDGYLDLLYPEGGYLKVRFYVPSSNSFATAISTGIAVGDPAREQYQLTDIDGDGHSDLIRVVFNTNNTSSIYVYKSLDANRVTQRITSVDNGLGNVTTISYKPLTDPSVYTAANDANNVTWPASSDGTAKPYPVFDLLGTSYVVSSVSSTAPAANDSTAGQVNYAATSSVSYKYGGAKAQAAGRGMLGFASITTTDGQSRVVTTTTYRQDFPFIGQPIKTVVQTASNNIDAANRLLKQSENHAIAIARAGADGTTYYQIYPDRVTEATYDLATGSEISYVVTTTGAPDSWGNVPSTTATTYPANNHAAYLTQIETANSYGTTTFDKQFGRLSRTSVTHRRAGVSNKTRASAFEYYNSGALQGLLYREIIEPDDSALTITTEYAYDGFGNKTRVARKAAGMNDRYTATEFDAAGRYPTATKSVFCSAYSGSSSTCNTWTEQTTEAVAAADRNAFGQPTKITGLNGIVTTIQYDSLGREKQRSDNTGAAVTTIYSRGGQIAGAQYQIKTQSNTGGVATDSFDALGRSIAKSKVGFDGRTIISETEYDNVGRIKRQAQPHFIGYATYWTTNTYDSIGRLKTQVTPAPDGGTASSSFAYSVVTLQGTQQNATTTTITNALGQTRKEFRNAAGELIEVDDYLGGMVGFGYDALGQLVRTSNINGAQTQTILTDLTYDQLGRKIKMVDADKGTWFYKYNPFGELTDQYKVTSVTNYTGTLESAISAGVVQRTHMDYDQRGRMIARADYLESGTTEGTASWIYDTAANGIGQLKTESGGGLTLLYSYDSLGRPSGTMHTDDSGSYPMSVTYDGFGRPLVQTDAVGANSGTANSYNGNGYLQGVTDLASNTVLYQAQASDPFGNTTSALLGNGGTSTWAYDPGTGQLLNQKAVVGLYTLVDLTYTWDAVGNQTSRTDKGMIATAPGTYRNLQQSFCYDGLNRLIKTASSAYSSSYCSSLTSTNQDQQYDAFGNITWKTGIGGYAYGDAARPHTLTATSGGSVLAATNYTYDKTGNLISDTSGRTLAYSVFDKPTLITSGGDQVSFAYGPDRSYYKRTDVKGGITTRTYHIGGVEKVVKSDNSYEIKRYIAGVAIWTHKFNSSGAQIALEKQFTYKDVLGSIVLITDGIGGIKGQMAFDEWGKRVSYNDWRSDQSSVYAGLQVSQLFTTQGYTGHDMLDAVGLIHMQGRIYDARLGRFVQADPIVQDAVDLQAYNRYSYVRNNPLTLTDPSGFSWLSKAWKHAKKAILYTGPIGETIAAYKTMQAIPYEVNQAIISVVSVYCTGWYAACVAGGTYINGRAHGLDSDHALTSGVIAGVSAYAFGPMNLEQAAFQVAGSAIAAENPAFGQVYSVVVGATRGGFSFQNLVGQSEKYLAGKALERFAVDHGLTLQELNLILAANSALGLKLAGSTYNETTHELGGFFNRGGGALFPRNSFAGVIWDVNDSLLNSQGLLDAVSRTVVTSGYSGSMEGHSLGAWRVNNLFFLGLIDGARTMSLPLFTYAAEGSSSWCINTDPICGGALLTPLRADVTPLNAPEHLINSHDWGQYRNKTR